MYNNNQRIISDPTVGKIVTSATKNEPSKKPRKKPGKKSKSSNKVQYIVFSLLGIASALTVMMVWYSSREEKNNVGISLQMSLNETLFDSTCHYWEVVGDGYCDDVANIEHCGYDLNDCCKMGKDTTLCSDCTCFIPKNQTETIKGEFMDEFCPEDENRLSHYSDMLGDGVCHLNLNKGKTNISNSSL